MELQWLVTTLIAAASAIIVAFGASIARDRAIQRMIRDGDDKLHERVNRIRDEISDKYVRREDLDAHMQRIEGSIRDVREDLKDNTKTLTQVLAHLKQNVTGG